MTNVGSFDDIVPPSIQVQPNWFWSQGWNANCQDTYRVFCLQK
jgi:hypothetical protein